VDPDRAAKRLENRVRFIERMRGERRARDKKRGRDEREGGGGDAAERGKEIVAFASQLDFPPRQRLNQVKVDTQREAVLVPWCGTLVPIALQAIKSVVQQDEGDKHFLRLNLFTPQGSLGKDVAPAMAGAVERHARGATWVKTLSFQAKDGRNFTVVEQQIKALLKRLRDKRKDEKELVGVREQPRVKEIKGAAPKGLKDIDMWPAIVGRKRSQGNLELHTNGFIFRSQGERVEIHFSNIKTGIYQPCDKEDKALVHFHLHHPIIINKKQYRDVQFYAELVGVESLGQRGRSDYDPDEHREEAEQRAVRENANRRMLKFVRSVEDACAAEGSDAGDFRTFETAEYDPELVFAGRCAAKDTSLVHLSSQCIFSVSDRPPTVVAIADIECVHFERVAPGGTGGKTFDMVLVLKEGVLDKGQPQTVTIGAIDMKKLDVIKDWLDSLAELVFTEHMIPQKWEGEQGLVAQEVRKPHFWEDVDADTGQAKLPGLDGVLWDPEEIEAMEEEEDEEEEAYESEEDSDEDDEDDESVYSSDDVRGAWHANCARVTARCHWLLLLLLLLLPFPLCPKTYTKTPPLPSPSPSSRRRMTTTTVMMTMMTMRRRRRRTGMSWKKRRRRTTERGRGGKRGTTAMRTKSQRRRESKPPPRPTFCATSLAIKVPSVDPTPHS